MPSNGRSPSSNTCSGPRPTRRCARSPRRWRRKSPSTFPWCRSCSARRSSLRSTRHSSLRSEDLMYQHILIPTDGSELADKAVEAGTNYAREANAKVLFFTAVPEYQPPSEADMMAHKRVKSIFDYEKDAAESARAILDKAAAGAKDANVAFEVDFAMSDH